MIDSELINIISNVGFPIFVALYFLFYTNKILEELKGVVKRNNELLEELKDLIFKLLNK